MVCLEVVAVYNMPFEDRQQEAFTLPKLEVHVLEGLWGRWYSPAPPGPEP